MSLASLPMYDLPALRAATDGLWAGLARAMVARGIDGVPARLDRERDREALWRSPDLLFSQTCGYPLTHDLAGQVTLLATPVYRILGRQTSDYCSLLLVREEDPASTLADLRGRRAAINAEDSQSGYSALRHAVAPLAQAGRFFAEVLTSGAHLRSAALVREGEADVCAIDAVTYALAQRANPPALAGLRVLAETAWAPNLPYVTRRGADGDLLDRLRAALETAMADPDLAAVREDLLLAGIEVLPPEAYGRIVEMEAEARDLGYPRIA